MAFPLTSWSLSSRPQLGIAMNVSPSSPSRSPRFFPATSRIKLNRRWSLDNLSESEGSLRDLRKLQHTAMGLSAIRDEEYPLMLTDEINSDAAAGAAAGATAFTPTRHPKRFFHGRGRSGSMDSEGHFRKTPVAGLRIVSGAPHFSSSVDISVVPEEVESVTETNEPMEQQQPPLLLSQRTQVQSQPQPQPQSQPQPQPQPLSQQHQGTDQRLMRPIEAKQAFLRQRSSSLPRILPPILDDDNDDASNAHQSDLRQSNVVVREMQKFICRQATDVSQLLPLPIPSNSRQERTLLSSSAVNHGLSSDASVRRQQSLLVMSTLAKVHGIFLAIKQTCHALYADFLNTLALAKLSADERQADQMLAQMRGTGVSGTEESDSSRICRQMASLCSSAALPFSVIAHGNVHVDSVVFRHDNAGRPVSLMLSGLTKAFLGSPLLDFYTYLLDEEHYGVGGFAVGDLLFDMLREYHSQLTRTCVVLRVSTNCLTLRQLVEDFRCYAVAGVILATLVQADNHVPSTTATQRSISLVKAIHDSCKKMYF